MGGVGRTQQRPIGGAQRIERTPDVMQFVVSLGAWHAAGTHRLRLP
jgi:hypothetical protein